MHRIVILFLAFSGIAMGTDIKDNLIVRGTTSGQNAVFAGSVSGQSAMLGGTLSGQSAVFAGSVSGQSAVFAGSVSGQSAVITNTLSAASLQNTGTGGNGYVFLNHQSSNPTYTGVNSTTLFAKSGNVWMVGPTGQVSQVTPTVISATSGSVTSVPCLLTPGASMQITGACATYYSAYTGAVGFAATGIVLAEGQTVTWVMQNTNAGADNAITWGASPALKWRFGTTYSTVYRSSSNVYTFMLVNGLVYVAAMDQMKAP